MLIYTGPTLDNSFVIFWGSNCFWKIKNEKFRFSSVNSPKKNSKFWRKKIPKIQKPQNWEGKNQKIKKKKSLNLPYTSWIWLDPLLSHNNNSKQGMMNSKARCSK
jgi:hypothetical protein